MKNRNAFHGGSYSLLITAVVLAILIVINIFVSYLPAGMTRYDISATQLYSISNNTKAIVNSLDQEVTIHWIVQSGEEDDIIETLLSKYDSLSDNIKVEKINPDVYPTWAAQYTMESVANNSLVVTSGEKFRYVAFSDIYVTSGTENAPSTSFDGEGAITSAINFVTTDSLSKLYVLSGHGESAPPANFTEQVDKANITMEALPLLSTGYVPEDADCLMVYAPATDISIEEAKLLSNYIAEGGKMMVVAGLANEPLDNLYMLLSEYGIETYHGLVIEGDTDHYAMNMPHFLMPEMAETDVTNSLIENNYTPIFPVANGLIVRADASSSNITRILGTTDSAYSKLDGYNISTYDRQEGDIDGPFYLAVSVKSEEGGEMIWFASSLFLDDTYNAYSSGANVEMAMNAVSTLIGDDSALAIRSRSLNYNYLTISESTSATLKVLMVAVFPLTYLAVGLIIMIVRRAKHETR